MNQKEIAIIIFVEDMNFWRFSIWSIRWFGSIWSTRHEKVKYNSKHSKLV